MSRKASVALRQTAAKRSARAAMTIADRYAVLENARRRRRTQEVDLVGAATAQHVHRLPGVSARVVQLSAEALANLTNERVCSVCDAFHIASDLNQVKIQRDDALVNAMRARLKPPANLPRALLEQYSTSDLYPAFQGILLSRAGIHRSEGIVTIDMCTPCKRSLSNKKLACPPKYSIANGLYIGELPEAFSDTTFTENTMLNLAQPMHYISVVRGGKHSSLRSHAYFFKADPAPPAQLLPQDVIASGIIGVTMVGALTPAQKAATLRKYDVRVPRLQSQLSWYKEHNRLYAQVHERPNWVRSASASSTRVVVDATDPSELQEDTVSPAATYRGLDDLGPRLQSTGTRGGDELDRAMWRHNAPAPAVIAQDLEDEVAEQAAVSFLSDFSQADGVEGLQQMLDKKNAVVYRSTGIISDFDKSFWVHAFGELFPFGRGGLDEPRTIAISLPEFVKHCMRLSSRRHSQHPSFCLVAFDVIARHNAATAINIRAKMSPSSMENASRVSRDALEAYTKYTHERLSALREQRPVPEPPVHDTRLQDLYSSLTVGMRAFWGSNDERAMCRSDLMSLQSRFGQPTIFFTLSPDCSSSLRVGVLAGVFHRDVLTAIESSVQECVEYSRARLGHIATSNPYHCARFFDILMRVFIGVVLNWDSEQGRARTDPGLFGRTKAFYCATESQSSTGSLHSHMLIWVDEMPTTVDQYYEMCGNPRFREAMIKYVDALTSSSVPLDMTKCPSCHIGEINAIPLQQQAFHKPRRGVDRPPTAKCKHCGRQFGAGELIAQHCQRVEGGVHVSDEAVLRQVAGTQPLTISPERSESAKCARALLFYQHHHWQHSKSCFKKTRRTPKGRVCRMFMPKAPCEKTHWTDDNRIEPKRRIGNEYINTYVPVVNAIFKCNHDIKLLGAGEGPEKAFYMMKYTTKDQQDIENPSALHLHAFDKSVERFNGDPDDPAALGRRRVQSMCCTLSNPHEVSAPMACLYLINGTAMYSSHKFSRLNVPTILKALFQRQDQVDVVLEEDTDDRYFRVSTVFQDYIFRPHDLEDVSLMTFASQWERRKAKSGRRFMAAHPLHATHSLFRRSEAHVVTLGHKRLADTRRSELPNEELLRFQRTVMVLFRPFRRATDLLNEYATFGESYEHWWSGDARDEAREFVSNHLDYYASRELTKTRTDPEAARYESYEESEIEDEDSHSIADQEPQDDIENTDCDLDDFVLHTTQRCKHIEMLAKTAEVTQLSARSNMDASSNARIDVDLQQLEVLMSANREVGGDSGTIQGCRTIPSEFPDVETRVRMLTEACASVEANSSTKVMGSESYDPDSVPAKPSLLEVSRLLNLNEKQHKMFAAAGENLLTSLLAPFRKTSQFVGFLGGLPGAGKSRVIMALQVLASKWGAIEAVATAAYQGVAAQAANGQTIHKLFGWRVNSRKAWTPTREQRERFAQLKLLILDEISTCDVKILGQIDSSLQKLTGREVCFGGVDVLLVGDWLQQLPVAGQPAFLPVTPIPTPMKKKTQKEKEESDAYLVRVRGAAAYKAVNFVVILTENMRHRADPTWRAILDRWRVGRYDPADIAHVNRVAYEDNWKSRPSNCSSYCPIIVTSNALRVEFNASTIRCFCAQAKVPLHRFPASVTRHRHVLTAAQRRSLECVRDDKTKGMPMLLEIAIGSVVQCTKNVSTDLKLANGSIATVVSITPANADQVHVSTVEGIEVHTHSLPPDIVFVKLKEYGSHRFVAGLPLGVVPVVSRVENSVSIEMAVRSFSITITQVPLVSAYSLTTEKCQGLTVDKMVLAPLKHPTRSAPQKSSFYVGVTRVKSLSQLYLMAPLTPAFLAYFKPRPEALEESNRLQGFENDQA